MIGSVGHTCCIPPASFLRFWKPWRLELRWMYVSIGSESFPEMGRELCFWTQRCVVLEKMKHTHRWVSEVFVSTDARRACSRAVIGSTVGAYPMRGRVRIPSRGMGTFFPHAVSSIFHLSLTRTHARARARTHARTHAHTQPSPVKYLIRGK